MEPQLVHEPIRAHLQESQRQSQIREEYRICYSDSLTLRRLSRGNAEA